MSNSANGHEPGALRDPEPHDRIEGWKAIAAALGRNEQYARRAANEFQIFRLPVRENHRGVYITRWNLLRWMEDIDRPWQSGMVNRRGRRAKAQKESGGLNG